MLIDLKETLNIKKLLLIDLSDDRKHDTSAYMFSPCSKEQLNYLNTNIPLSSSKLELTTLLWKDFSQKKSLITSWFLHHWHTITLSNLHLCWFWGTLWVDNFIFDSSPPDRFPNMLLCSPQVVLWVCTHWVWAHSITLYSFQDTDDVSFIILWVGTLFTESHRKVSLTKILRRVDKD